MLALVPSGIEEGFWLRARRQTAGRGRHGRDWVSLEGNLYASTVVRLQPHDPAAASLAFVAAITIRDVLASYAPLVTFSIKWPNDVLVGNAKICGILLERLGDGVVVGIGANLAHHPTNLDRPTTNLAALGAPLPNLDQFAEDLAQHFATCVARWRAEGLGPILAQWLAHAHPIGTPLKSILSDGVVIAGKFDGLDPSGGLALRLADGTVHVIHAGDVFFDHKGQGDASGN